MSYHVTITPRHGWATFEESAALTDHVWRSLPVNGDEAAWHYLNLSSDTSIWEHFEEEGATFYLAYDSDLETLVECVASSSLVSHDITSSFARWVDTLCETFDLVMRGEEGEVVSSLAAMLRPSSGE